MAVGKLSSFLIVADDINKQWILWSVLISIRIMKVYSEKIINVLIRKNYVYILKLLRVLVKTTPTTSNVER